MMKELYYFGPSKTFGQDLSLLETPKLGLGQCFVRRQNTWSHSSQLHQDHHGSYNVILDAIHITYHENK